MKTLKEIDTENAKGIFSQFNTCLHKHACHNSAIEIKMLREALEQLLDDMGEDGHCVCEAAKQQAIEALKLCWNDSEKD